jgi:hypothetical protein
MSIVVKELQPGILITEQVSIRGGITYEREGTENYLDDRTRVRKWKTKSIIEDETEYNEARNLRSSAYAKIRQICVRTPAGLICPVGRKDKLTEAISGIEEKTKEFNDSAKTCRLITRYFFHSVDVNNKSTIKALTEQIADVALAVEDAINRDDERTLESVPSRILKGLSIDEVLQMSKEKRDAVIARARAYLIRSAISEIKYIEELLPDHASERVRELVRDSRQIARDICRKVEKKNLSIEEALMETNPAGISRARASFARVVFEEEKSLPSVSPAVAFRKKMSLSQGESQDGQGTSESKV